MMTSSQLTIYRLKTALSSLIAIYRLPQDQIDAFLRSYESLNTTMGGTELRVFYKESSVS